jgi:hypothetical protein
MAPSMLARPTSPWLRVTALLAMLWVAVGIGLTAMVVPGGLGTTPPLKDGLFVGTFLGTSVFIAAVFAIWWRFVSWSFGRITATGAVTAAVLGHLLLWKPLWAAGCVAEDLLRLGQSLSASGAWVVVMAYLWWGLAEGFICWRKRIMSSSVARVIRGIGLVPLVPGLWWIVFLATRAFVTESDRYALMATHLVCGLLITTWWLGSYRRAITWTGRLKRRTALITTVYLVLGVLAGALPGEPDWVATLRFSLPLILTGLWFLVTAWLWQPHQSMILVERDRVRDFVRCTSCGYSLVGLHEARCPECGESWTLERLFEDMLVIRESV